MKIGLLKFEQEVRLRADASAAIVAERLRTVVAPSFSFDRAERRKPLRGRVSAEGGLLRWPLRDRPYQSARVLCFKLADGDGGSSLIGKFQVGRGLWIPMLLWLGWGSVYRLWRLVADLIAGSGIGSLWTGLLTILICYGMALGYTSFVVWVGHWRDRQLVRVLRVVLASEAGAHYAGLLLARPSKPEDGFIDPPEPANG